MNITVPDEVLKGMLATPDELLLDLAIGMFIDGRATLGQGSRIAGMSRPRFLKELGKRRVPVHYNADDFAADMELVKAL